MYVRKSPAGVSVNPDSNSIAVFEGSGSSHITVLASNGQTAGVVLGSPADTFGSYLTWNHDNSELKLGTDKAGGFISLLTDDELPAVRITSGGHVGIGTISPSEKLQVVGNILANNLVYNTGNQTISGTKTFDVFPIVSGNKLITGVDLSSYATITNLANTGSTLDSKIGSLSGTLTSNYATILNLASTGSTLNTKIDNFSGTYQNFVNNLDNTYATDVQLYTTGSTLDAKINSLSGNLTSTYATITNLASTGSNLNAKINNLSGISVLTFGNQTIGGNKTFTGITTFSGQEVNLVDTALNLSGVGDITFVGTNINFINSPVFISGTNLRVVGDAIISGSINISGNYDLYSQIENAKKLAIAYAIAL